MDGADANFMESSKEVFGDGRGLLEVLDANVGHCGQ